jgi:N-acetylglucosamine malate deacetylase 1
MNGRRILAFGAHPDDIEFGCGAFLLDAADKGAQIHLAVLSKGEAGTHGDAATRVEESRQAARMLGADLQFPPTAGDTRIRNSLELSQELARCIRVTRPDLILAPTGHPNQHPDHRETNLLVRDAYRLARYGNTPDMADLDAHTAQLLLFYEISSGCAAGEDLSSILVDVSQHVERWQELMQCHASQTRNMDYVDLQLARARAYGIQVGVHSAQRLYSESPMLASSAADLANFRSQRF